MHKCSEKWIWWVFLLSWRNFPSNQVVLRVNSCQGFCSENKMASDLFHISVNPTMDYPSCCLLIPVQVEIVKWQWLPENRLKCTIRIFLTATALTSSISTGTEGSSSDTQLPLQRKKEKQSDNVCGVEHKLKSHKHKVTNAPLMTKWRLGISH